MNKKFQWMLRFECSRGSQCQNYSHLFRNIQLFHHGSWINRSWSGLWLDFIEYITNLLDIFEDYLVDLVDPFGVWHCAESIEENILCNLTLWRVYWGVNFSVLSRMKDTFMILNIKLNLFCCFDVQHFGYLVIKQAKIRWAINIHLISEFRINFFSNYHFKIM